MAHSRHRLAAIALPLMLSFAILAWQSAAFAQVAQPTPTPPTPPQDCRDVYIGGASIVTCVPLSPSELLVEWSNYGWAQLGWWFSTLELAPTPTAEPIPEPTADLVPTPEP
jgi:hypothetical protein